MNVERSLIWGLGWDITNYFEREFWVFVKNINSLQRNVRYSWSSFQNITHNRLSQNTWGIQKRRRRKLFHVDTVSNHSKPKLRARNRNWTCLNLLPIFRRTRVVYFVVFLLWSSCAQKWRKSLFTVNVLHPKKYVKNLNLNAISFKINFNGNNIKFKINFSFFGD